MAALHTVPILSIMEVTHDVKCFRLRKPEGYRFVPGQATEVSVNKPGWTEEKRPFTFTSLNTDDYLEFTIKGYPEHQGVTHQLHQLSVGDELLIRDVWGAIEYKGPGYFIAGGAGITPFMAILRQLARDGQMGDNVLLFSNKTVADIIYQDELTRLLGSHARFLLTRETREGYEKGPIDQHFLEANIPDFSRHFYICGPDKMIQDISASLEKLGASADAVVFEH
ncbi:MAG: FAD-binding oxidoreductase [Candidatus Pseudobacter hemicellulosilyticus]|uniref:FAD-binding oxidoreductase n=1 Tax=Candidatus Pseudobacter hemicellulosilyticus TaxID=3121375 RepID=A0AAJ6BEC2_9BACT|nr:MAG: FAD-binding oxidoreductase [Pseudobacter sp.]